MLRRQVERTLPVIVERIRYDLRDARKELTNIGGPLPKTEKEKVN